MNGKLKWVGWGLALCLLAAAVGMVALKQNVLARLQVEHGALLSNREEAQRLVVAAERLAQLRAENTEARKLQEENQDLPRLRNEARHLRRDAEEFGKLQAENERLQRVIKIGHSGAGASAVPADFVARAAMGDVGLGTPEAAVQTAFWAMCQGNLERVAQCFQDGGPNLKGNVERERNDMMEGMKSFPGFRIAEKKMISPDEVELGMQSSMGGPAAPIKLKLVGNEWRIQH